MTDRASEQKEIEGLLLFKMGHLFRLITKSANHAFSRLNLPVQAEQIRILFELYYGGELSQQTIADNICRDKSSVQRTLIYMHKHNLIEISQDMQDKRRNIVHITDEGKKMTRILLREMKKINTKLSTTLTEAEKDTFIALCTKMEKSI